MSFRCAIILLTEKDARFARDSRCDLRRCAPLDVRCFYALSKAIPWFIFITTNPTALSMQPTTKNLRMSMSTMRLDSTVRSALWHRVMQAFLFYIARSHSSDHIFFHWGEAELRDCFNVYLLRLTRCRSFPANIFFFARTSSVSLKKAMKTKYNFIYLK